MKNEPGVCRPDEALDCFSRTKMEALVNGYVRVSRLKSFSD
jgi:predicted NodU family carbamoyl transferase